MQVTPIEQRMLSVVPAIAATAFVATASTLPALCPFRVWSGHACPLCGMTRAVGSLVTGDPGTALRYHPLVLLIALEAAVIGLYYTRTRRRQPASLTPWLMGVNAVVFAVVWLLRWRLDLLSFVLD